MNINISGLDCPQFVPFDSEDFLKDTSSLSAEDSIEKAENENCPVAFGHILSPNEQYERQLLRGENTQLDCAEATEINQNNSRCMSPSVQHSTAFFRAASTPRKYDDASDIDKENLGDVTSRTENFPLFHGKESSCSVKSIPLKVTVPKPFRFHTDTRLKNLPEEVDKYEKKDFVSDLRNNSILKPQKKTGPTKQQPFNLTEPKKRKHEDYQPLAEQVQAFQKRTPDRYHSSSNKKYQPPSHWSPLRIAARTPNLQACKRKRRVKAISREEQENKELDEIKSYEFHAKPVDPKIYKQPSTLKLHPFKTRAKDFRLKAANRSVMCLNNSRRQSIEKKFKFKARPVPKAILMGPTGLKEKPSISLTIPKAPDFKTDDRSEKRKIFEEKMLEKQIVKKKKTPKKKEADSIMCMPHKKIRTEIQPFSFDRADQQRFAQKEKRIQEEIENELKPHVFKAQMMPLPGPPSLPAVPKQPPTVVRPFHFFLEDRCLKSSDVSLDVTNSTFKAQPANVLKMEPFIPEKPLKQIIEIKEFNLHTDKRASDRQHLKDIKEQEEASMREALLVQKALEEEKERQELMRLRQELVHKANPVRQYKPLELQPSAVPLTLPESPDFETDKRIQKRHNPS